MTPSESKTRPAARQGARKPATLKKAANQQEQLEALLYSPETMTKFADNMGKIAKQTSELLETYANHQKEREEDLSDNEAAALSAMRAFSKMLASYANHPQEWFEAQFALYQQYLILWTNAWARLLGESVEPFNVAPDKDRRFKDEAWSNFLVFDYIKQSYFILNDWLKDAIANAEGLDEKTRKKLQFYARQWVEAVSPSNFVLTNPQVLRATLESGGENLVRGMENLLNDLQAGKGRLDVAMTDRSAFEVGKNLAITPGKVVYQNALMQLIQYNPTTATVRRAPLLITPPWINKYYILDLQPENSMVKWLLDQGHTVFMISWVNPDKKLARTRFEDYFFDGVMAALTAIETITGEKQTNVVGYCIAGTLMCAGLSYLKKTDRLNRVKSATLFTAQTDFSEPGELGVFLDEEHLDHLSKKLKEDGVFEGEDMSAIFRSLRASDLIWSFVVNNYLMGKAPFPFDLLYWNTDTTNLPADMHLFYLRKLYVQNQLVKPGGIAFGGQPIDLSDIDLPLYMLSTREDHIAPWQSTYALSRHVRGTLRFVLAGSGHIAGVINPPPKAKYGYWVAETLQKNYPQQPEQWLEKAAEKEGSWWLDWNAWLNRQEGGAVVDAATRHPGAHPKYPALEDAPGSYVRVRH